MWQVLTLTLILVGFVRTDTNCPGFSCYKNNQTLLDDLNGDFKVVYTTSSYVIDCEQISWTLGPNNTRTANLKDTDGCSRRIENFSSCNPEYLEHDIAPVSACTCAHLKSTERVHKKIIRKTECGTNLCLFIYICHPSRSGLLVVCRETPQPTLLVSLGQILLQLLNLVLPTPTVLKTVNQCNCNTNAMV